MHGYAKAVTVDRVGHVEIAQTPHVVYAEKAEDVVDAGGDFHVGLAVHSGYGGTVGEQEQIVVCGGTVAFRKVSVESAEAQYFAQTEASDAGNEVE